MATIRTVLENGQIIRADIGEDATAAAAFANAAEASADDAAQSAAYAGGFETPEYASQSAGNAATTAGQIFRVPIGTTPQTFNWYRRLASGSELVDPLATVSVLAGSGGAAEVGFLQSGTSAVARTVQAKLRESVSVKDFGAVGDGVVNDRPAFVAAVAAAGGREILVPPGAYNIATPYDAPRTTKFVMQTGASFVGNKPGNAAYFYETGNQSSAGGLMKVDRVWENDTGFPPENEGGIWSADTYAFFTVSAELYPGIVPAPGDGTLTGGPLIGIFSFINQTGSGGDAVALQGNAVARVPNSTVFASNLIARNDAGCDGAKLVGLEIDVVPANGTTVSTSSVGLILNVFNTASEASVGLINAVGGGTWQDGMISGSIRGAHYARLFGDPTVSTCFINTAGGTYSGAAIQLGKGAPQAISFGAGAFGTSPYLYSDTSNNLILTLGSGNFWQVQDSFGVSVFEFNTASRTFYTRPTIVASLPPAGQAGRRAIVTNANATTFASIVAGSGANTVPVYDDGTNWRIG